MNLFLTGASGFIGGHLLPSLTQAHHSVICSLRSEKQAKEILEQGANFWHGDLFDVNSLAAALEGVDVLIHAAGCRDLCRSTHYLELNNHLLTRAVLAAAKLANVSQFIFISAASVVIQGPMAMIGVDETLPVVPKNFLPYSRSKAMAEQEVITASNEKMRTIVLRPSFVWGLGDGVDTLIGPAVASYQFGWFSGGRYPFATCSIQNLCEAVHKTIAYPGSGGIFFISDREAVEFRTFLSHRLLESGYSLPKFSVSRYFAWWLARFTENGWKYLLLPGSAPLVREMVCLMGYPFTVSIDKARRELDFQAYHSFESKVL